MNQYQIVFFNLKNEEITNYFYAWDEDMLKRDFNFAYNHRGIISISLIPEDDIPKELSIKYAIDLIIIIY